MTRSQEREQAFILVYQKAFCPEESLEEIINLSVESEFLKPSNYTELLSKTTIEKVGEIDAKISEFAIGWTLERISKVNISILRIAVCEMLFFEDVPVGVSINEAVELAKKYATEKDGKFINGVLGSISRSL